MITPLSEVIRDSQERTCLQVFRKPRSLLFHWVFKAKVTEERKNENMKGEDEKTLGGGKGGWAAELPEI